MLKGVLYIFYLAISSDLSKMATVPRPYISGWKGQSEIRPYLAIYIFCIF